MHTLGSVAGTFYVYIIIHDSRNVQRTDMSLSGIYTLCNIQLTCDLSLNRPFLPYVLFRSLPFTETV